MDRDQDSRLVYWVTGASSGLGLEICRQLAARGHRVYATARNAAALQQLAEEFPGNVVPLACDVSDQEAMAQLFRAANSPTHLDAVILAAGICEYIDMADFDLVLLRKVMEVNFFGSVNTCLTALPLLEAAVSLHPRRRPEIVGISSLSTVIGFPRNGAYGSSKAALQYFLEALRCDIGNRMQVTTVQPGFIKTPLTAANDFPMPFMMSAQQAADWLIRHLGKRRNHLAFPWQLALLLRIASRVPRLWYGPVMNRLSRYRNSSP